MPPNHLPHIRPFSCTTVVRLLYDCCTNIFRTTDGHPANKGGEDGVRTAYRLTGSIFSGLENGGYEKKVYLCKWDLFI